MCGCVCSTLKQSQSTSLLEAEQSRRETMQTDGTESLNNAHIHTHTYTQMSIVSKVAIKASTGTTLPY